MSDTNNIRPQAVPGKKKKKKVRKHSRALSIVLSVLLTLFAVCLLTGSMVAFDVFSDIGLFAEVFSSKSASKKEIAGVDYIDLDEYINNQSQTSIIYAYNEKKEPVEIARLHGTENRIWVSLDEMSDYLKTAIVCLEDKRFYDHDGVDWVRTTAVVVKYNFSQGGSTITQQLIKNLTGENGRTFIRKYNEIKNALALEMHYDKNVILEAYLNTLYLDSGCYGVETAAEYYFGKDVSELTLMESAMLASITNAPRTYNPIINYEYNRKRATECLIAMRDQGKISQEQFNDALNEKIKLLGYIAASDESKNSGVTEISSNEYQSYYVDFVIDSVIKDLQVKYDLTESEAWRKVYYGGLKIYSAVDLSVQDQMEDVYYNRITFPKEEDTEENPAIQSAMTIMDYTGRVVGIVGRLGEKQGDRVLNIAADSPRQPGSSIKPLSAYCPAIELNYYYWSSYIPNYGMLQPDGTLWPKNYGGSTGSPNDYKDLPQAIAPSLNTVPARIVSTITALKCYDFLTERFHISTLMTSDANLSSLAVGGMTVGVTTLEMAAAYTVFGNGGKYIAPWCYYKVYDNNDSVLLEPDTTGEQVISAGTADVMLELLKTVFSYGTCSSYGVNGFTTYGKSGTTTANRDKWVVGATPYYVCATWTGFEYNKEINTSFYGSNPAGKVFKEVMNRIHTGCDSGKDFVKSDESVKRAFCTKTGLLASSSCTSTSYGWYKTDYMPRICTSCTKAPEAEETTVKETPAAPESPAPPDAAAEGD